MYTGRYSRGGIEAVYNKRDVNKWYAVKEVWKSEGDKNFERREYVLAADYYNAALKRGADSFDELWIAAMTSHRVYMNDEAVAAMERCYQLQPHDLEIRLKLRSWSKPWCKQFDLEDDAASRIQGLARMKVAKTEMRLRYEATKLMCKWMRYRLKCRRGKRFWILCYNTAKRFNREASFMVRNERLATKFFASLVNRKQWRVFTKWKLYKTRSQRVRRMFAQSLVSLQRVHFQKWSGHMEAIHAQQNEKVKNAVRVLKFGCLNRCFIEWARYVANLKYSKNLVRISVLKSKSEAMRLWKEFSLKWVQRDYLLKRAQQRKLAAEDALKQAQAKLDEAAEDISKKSKKKLEKQVAVAKKAYAVHQDSDSDEYDDEW